jgi:hypothetical protein
MNKENTHGVELKIGLPNFSSMSVWGSGTSAKEAKQRLDEMLKEFSPDLAKAYLEKAQKKGPQETPYSRTWKEDGDIPY